MPDDWREKYLAKVDKWEKENRQSSELFAQNLKTELDKVKTKINRLMDACLEGDLELPEFQLKKNELSRKRKPWRRNYLILSEKEIIGSNSQGIG